MTNATVKNAKTRSFGKLLVVQYSGFRGLAYRDAAGKLRNFWNQKLVRLPVHILDPED